MAVDTPHGEYLEFAGKWAKARDAAAGEEAVKARRDEYLPMLKGQNKDDYAAYLNRTLYSNATARTVDGLSGMIFRRAPVITRPPEDGRLRRRRHVRRDLAGRVRRARRTRSAGYGAGRGYRRFSPRHRR